MANTTIPRKIIEVNRTIAETAMSNAANAMKTVGQNTKNVLVAARTAGRIVTGQATSVVERTVKTARDGSREVTGQVMAQGSRVGETISTQANRTADAALRAVSDKPASGTAYEQWTKTQLIERARDVDLEGRGSMNKAELIAALRS